MKLKKHRVAIVLLLGVVADVHSAATVTYSATAKPDDNPDGTGTVNVWTTSIIGTNAGFFP